MNVRSGTDGDNCKATVAFIQWRGWCPLSCFFCSQRVCCSDLATMNLQKWPTASPRPVQISHQLCAEENMNVFGILRSKQRQLQCGHSWGRCNRWLGFLLLWWVVLSLQRRYFFNIHENNVSSFGQNWDLAVFYLLRRCPVFLKNSYLIEYNII